MITFTKKTDAQPLPNDATENRFDQIRKAAAKKHRSNPGAEASDQSGDLTVPTRPAKPPAV